MERLWRIKLDENKNTSINEVSKDIVEHIHYVKKKDEYVK